MNYLYMLLIGYAVLYATVWLHEIGHAIGYAYYGCKEKWYHVTVKPYIFFSTPLPIDMEKAKNLLPKQNIVISYAGVFVNFICAIIGGIIIGVTHIPNEYFTMGLWLFMTLHFAELVSYMFIGNIYLVSDMASVANCKKELRIPGLIIGSIMAVGYVIVLMNLPSAYVTFIIVWNILVVMGMCGGRIVFSIIKA